MRQKVIVRSLAAAGLATVVGVGAVQYYEPATAHAVTAPTATSMPLAALPDFSRLVEQYGPAVVNVSVTHDAQSPANAAIPDFGMSPDDPFYEFFRRFQIPGQPGTPQMPQQPRRAQGVGSGFIVSADGTILTNAHVVQNASEVTVRLTDRREFKAKVVGVDPQTDVAVLEIDAKNLPVVKLGSSKDLRVGDWVVAIGSPYGFESTVTSGIVSAKSRALPDGTYVPFIQTDVAVNPGNSGGPLFNLKGEVIGINAQIYSRTGGYQGLSFAIPIDTALHVKDQLVQHGKVTRGRLGVTIQEVNQSLANSFGLDSARGALVSSVGDGTPAEKAGLKAGDVILKIDGSDIQSSVELSSRVATMKPGTTTRVEVWRDGKPREIAVTVGEAPSQQMAASDKVDLSGSRLGVAVRELTPEEQQQAKVDGGVVVQQSAGVAAKAGIRAGDIILSADGKPVKNVDDLKTATADAAGKTMALLVQRNDGRIFVPVTLG